MACKLSGKYANGNRFELLAINAHIPANSTRKKSVVTQITGFCRKYKSKNQRTPIVFVGDFNLDIKNTVTYLNKIGIGLIRATVNNSSGTRINAGKIGRMIDHITYSGIKSRPIYTKVLRSVDLSDHLPVITEWPMDKLRPITKSIKINSSKIKDEKIKFSSDNRFAILEDADLSTNDVVNSTIDKIWYICKESQYISGNSEKYPGIFSVKTKNLISKRRKDFVDYKNGNFSLQEYISSKERALKSRRADYKNKKLKEVQTACKMQTDNSPRQLWKWLKFQSKRYNTSLTDGPVYDKEKKLVTDSSLKSEVWASHFEELAKDTSGNSRNHIKWVNMMPNIKGYYQECDLEIEWEDIKKALNNTPSNKAPGVDGIPSEVWKTVQDEEIPTSNLAKLLYKVVKRIWNMAYIPEKLNTSIVVPIPKKGDLRDPNNYRGISLIPTLVKIVAKVAASKLSFLDLKYNILVKEQAGFRSREECVAQATVLYEIVRRRKIKGLPTWIGFIDFAKAYDRVPHQALLQKLKIQGIGGHLHKVISALYKSPKICVRFGSYLSPVVEYNCGVRQGCPASPILFDLYINDLFENIKGITVPEIGEKIKGLLFADDAVVFADSPAKLQIAFEKVSQWAKKWEMQVNASKCGVMGIGSQTNMLFTIQGGAVPQVEHYKYLGVMFNDKWNHRSVINNNSENSRRAMNGMYFFLGNKNIPIALRATLIRSVLIPIATYGGELFGMSKARTSKLQTVIDTASRLVIGSGKTIALHRLREELKLTTVYTKTAVARERAFYKWPTLKTWITDLIEYPMKSRLDTWVSGTRRWTKRFCDHSAPGETLKYLDRRTRANEYSVISNWLKSSGIGRIRNVTGLELIFPENSKGIQEIIKIRTGLFRTAMKLAKSKIIDRKYLQLCPFCKNNVPESVEHLILECSKWTQQRQEHLGEFLPTINHHLPGSTRIWLLGRLLGGELIYTTSGIRKNSDKPAVRAVLGTASFLSATTITRTITLHELIGAPTSWTQSRNGMETLVGRDGVG
ncbi:RNA-directed DNA polymerase from mobile element jockey [Smittium mucronatum]|uniref:RNA-directed DNA polymerase from mobile element jockey n=1 Tax=Smittium mucronatum TaxID=133383 RepID=A0A1R0GP03_9FUNG|nr:RNA-directed DNA polymerase from mobile element jockey [Smittium mucronatum]